MSFLGKLKQCVYTTWVYLRGRLLASTLTFSSQGDDRGATNTGPTCVQPASASKKDTLTLPVISACRAAVD